MPTQSCFNVHKLYIVFQWFPRRMAKYEFSATVSAALTRLPAYFRLHPLETCSRAPLLAYALKFDRIRFRIYNSTLIMSCTIPTIICHIFVTLSLRRFVNTCYIDGSSLFKCDTTIQSLCAGVLCYFIDISSTMYAGYIGLLWIMYSGYFFHIYGLYKQPQATNWVAPSGYNPRIKTHKSRSKVCSTVERQQNTPVQHSRDPDQEPLQQSHTTAP